MRIKDKVNIRIAKEAEFKNILFGPDDALAERVVDSWARYASGNLSIDAGETESLSFGDVTTVKGMYLEVTGECQLVINGADPIQLRKSGTDAALIAKVFIEADISSVTLTAPLTVAVTGIYCFWGDSV
jgi:hypothetical protein